MSVELSEPARVPLAAQRQSLAALGVFAVALFSSAFLLFWVEPLFARMLLPRLGGSQGVWNTCLVFFQASLLLGYTYAHTLTRWLSLRWQIAVHLAVIAIGAFFLPIALNAAWAPPAEGSPVFPVLGILAGALGWPFFALSANGPLLQSWFSRSTHRHAANPYFLYAASNAGSLAALLAYPFVLEPALTLTHQSSLWAIGYTALGVSVAAAGVIAVLQSRRVNAVADAAPAVAAPITWRMRLTWLAYAAVPSSLLIGVTAYITTDIASFPLIWLAPLALYLVTFVLTFASRPPLPHKLMAAALPRAVVLAAIGFWIAPYSLAAALAIQFAAFFIVAMACHGELARTRPPAAKLTEFYFWMSLGGVAGGALTALVSPFLFKEIIEYPMMLACACVLRPGAATGNARTRAAEIALLLAAILLVLGEPFASLGGHVGSYVSVAIVVALLVYGVWPKHAKLGVVALSLMLGGQAARTQLDWHGAVVGRERSFYGAYTVTEVQNHTYRLMFHGKTLHGIERIGTAGRPVPMSYYAAPGPLGDVMRALGGASHSVGVIGLGIGSTACYARPDQAWTFYEIDPLVHKIAAQSGLFRSLGVCAPQANYVFGDGRLRIEGEPAAEHDMLIVDAFSSDAIPIHLMTREAFASYVRALKPHGVLVLHVTNRHLDLAPIVARIAPEAGLVAYDRLYLPGPDVKNATASRWMILARSATDIGAIASDPNWTRRDANPKTKLWTDDFSDILSAMH